MRSRPDYNILLITIDTLRFDEFLLLSRGRSSLASIFRRSVVFWNCTSPAPYTKPAFKSIMTGLLPFTGGGYHSIAGLTSIASLLASRGYVTCGIPNHWILSRRYGYGDGFKLFVAPRFPQGRPRDLIAYRALRAAAVAQRLPMPTRRIAAETFFTAARAFSGGRLNVTCMDASEAVSAALAFLKGAMRFGRPFYLWMHFMDLHYPYNAVEGCRLREAFEASAKALGHVEQKAEIREETLSLIRRIRMACLEYIDSQISRIIEFLEGKGLDSSTIVFVLSDHGEELGEHGAFGHTGYAYWTHMYEELLRVPLLMLHPNIGYKIVRDPVSTIDLMPTISEIACCQQRGVEGISLLTVLDNAPCDRVIVGEASLYNRGRGSSYVSPFELRIMAVKAGRWKLIYRERGSCELYDLSHDPREKRNLAGEKRDLCALLKELCIKRIRATRQWALRLGLGR